jgi:hypothetical protein
MALPAKEMGRLLAKDLDAIIQTIEDELRTTWAVYTEYDHDHARLNITNIIPWAERHYDTEPTKIEDAIDEMAAYKKFLEQANDKV